MTETHTHALHAKKLAALLAMLVAVMPFSTDIYLPAVPSMASALHADIHRIEQSLSTFMFGVALGQLLGGPFSDLRGRRTIALTGLGIHALSTLLIIFVHSADQLLFLRCVQAVGGGMATVTVGATVRDFFHGREAARMFATIGIIMMAAPLAAPMIGAILQSAGGWKAIFVFLLLYAVAAWILIFRFLPEKKREKHPFTADFARDFIRNFLAVFQQREALGFMFFQAFSFASMFVFLTESPFVYMELYGLGPHEYAWAFGANVIGMMVFNRITAFRLRTTHSKNILLAGVSIQFLCNFLLCLAVWSTPLPSFALVLPLLVCSIGTQGLVVSNTQACFMSYYSKISGSANAMLGSLQFFTGACVGWLTTQLHNGTAHVMMSVMLASTVSGMILLALFSRHAWSRRAL